MTCSIIIPTFNRKDNLSRTLRCLQNQKFSPNHRFELIVVDDASTDGTMETLSSLLFPEFDHFQFIKLSQRDFWGASVPKNVGAKSSKVESETLLFIDSDVLLPPTVLQQYAEDYEAINDPTRVIIGPYHFLQESVPSVEGEWWEVAKNLKRQDDIRWKTFSENPVEVHTEGFGPALSCFGGNILIPRKLFFKAGGFDESIQGEGEDGDFGMTLVETGATISYDIRLLGWHNPHEILAARWVNTPKIIEYLDTKHKVDLVKEKGKMMRQNGIDFVVPEEWIKSGGYDPKDL